MVRSHIPLGLLKDLLFTFQCTSSSCSTQELLYYTPLICFCQHFFETFLNFFISFLLTSSHAKCSFIIAHFVVSCQHFFETFLSFFIFLFVLFLCLLFCFWAIEKLVTLLLFFLMFNHITSLYTFHIHLLISSSLINQRLIYINIFSLSCQQIF